MANITLIPVSSLSDENNKELYNKIITAKANNRFFNYQISGDIDFQFQNAKFVLLGIKASAANVLIDNVSLIENEEEFGYNFGSYELDAFSQQINSMRGGAGVYNTPFLPIGETNLHVSGSGTIYLSFIALEEDGNVSVSPTTVLTPLENPLEIPSNTLDTLQKLQQKADSIQYTLGIEGNTPYIETIVSGATYNDYALEYVDMMLGGNY